MRIVFYKAETAGCLIESIQAHNESLDFATFREELVDLFFGCVEGPIGVRWCLSSWREGNLQVSYVEGSGVLQWIFCWLFWSSMSFVSVITVPVVFALLVLR